MKTSNYHQPGFLILLMNSFISLPSLKDTEDQKILQSNKFWKRRVFGILRKSKNSSPKLSLRVVFWLPDKITERLPLIKRDQFYLPLVSMLWLVWLESVFWRTILTELFNMSATSILISWKNFQDPLPHIWPFSNMLLSVIWWREDIENQLNCWKQFLTSSISTIYYWKNLKPMIDSKNKLKNVSVYSQPQSISSRSTLMNLSHQKWRKSVLDKEEIKTNLLNKIRFGTISRKYWNSNPKLSKNF